MKNLFTLKNIGFALTAVSGSIMASGLNSNEIVHICASIAGGIGTLLLKLA
jgi:hypothetical protein